MPINRRLPRTPPALAVLNLLHERPMHPYEMKAMMRERGHDRVIKLKGGSVYDTVERLHRLGFVEPLETSREGRRPERTVYRLTEEGLDELKTWLRELLSEPVHEYPQFGAALAFIRSLEKDEVVHLLLRRSVQMEGEVAGWESVHRALIQAGLPRLLVIEGEYEGAMRRAELAWVRELAAGIREGTLEWPDLQALQAVAHMWSLSGGGEVDAET